MGPSRPAKAMVTGVTLLVILSIAGSTFAASITNSTEVDLSKRHSHCRNNDYWMQLCAQFGIDCDDVFFDVDNCCCRKTECDTPLSGVPLGFFCAVSLLD